MTTGSILGQLGQAVGINSAGNMVNAINNSSAQQQYDGIIGARSTNKNQYSFSFEEIENGWLIIMGGKKWMVKDLDELKDQVVAVIVQTKLEK
jgi:hypothetical protein